MLLLAIGATTLIDTEAEVAGVQQLEARETSRGTTYLHLHIDVVSDVGVLCHD